MIGSFADKGTEVLFETEQTRRLPPALVACALLRLRHLHHVMRIEDLRYPPSNHLAALKGDRAGQWSIRINDQWRIYFRFEGGHAFDVKVVDYH